VTAVTLIVGDEELLVSRAVARVVGAALTPEASAAKEGGGAGGLDDAGSAREDVEAGGCSADQLAALVSPSLFAEHRSIVLRGLQDADKDLVAAVVAFAETPEPGIEIIAVHAGGAKGKASVDALKSAGARVVEVPRLTTVRDREQFVAEEVRAAGAGIDRDAAAELVGAIGSDLRELATAAAQLCADVGGQISLDEVAVYYRGQAESTGFAVADRAVEGNLGAALETLRWAFATGLDPILVSSSLAANLRLIAQVGTAGPGSPDAVAARLRMPAWKVRRAQGWLRRWRPEAVGEALQAVATADADLKGGADDAAYAVERAVMVVAAAANAAA
jgi:DNA polymerase III subunit delta